MKDIIKKLGASFRDERGVIENIVDDVKFSSVLRITCTKGARRANHFHKQDYHMCYLEKGEMEYYERPVGSKEKPIKITIKAGELFYTKPKVEHLMVFKKASVFWCFSKLSRKRGNYETDTVRLSFNLDEA